MTLCNFIRRCCICQVIYPGFLICLISSSANILNPLPDFLTFSSSSHNPLYHTLSLTFSHTLTQSHNTLTHCQTLGPPFSPFFAFFSCVFLFILLSSFSASHIDWSHFISHLQPSIFIVQPIFLILLSSKLLAASNIRRHSAAGVGCRGPTRRNMRPEIWWSAAKAALSTSSISSLILQVRPLVHHGRKVLSDSKWAQKTSWSSAPKEQVLDSFAMPTCRAQQLVWVYPQVGISWNAEIWHKKKHLKKFHLKKWKGVE